MILGVVQARMSSTRLPGKVMRPILGRPMIELQLERIVRASRLDKVVVATSEDATDDLLADFCQRNGIHTIRGALSDVLDRFNSAREAYAPDHVVRMTADCPLVDWTLIDKCIQAHLDSGVDYTSNTLLRTYPKGLDIEVMTGDALQRAWAHAKHPNEREHVTPYIYGHPEQFSLSNVAQALDQSALRWTVDTPGDFSFVLDVYEKLYPENPAFSTQDVAALEINSST